MKECCSLSMTDFLFLTANIYAAAVLCAKDEKSVAAAFVMNIVCLTLGVYFWLAEKRRKRDLELMR